MKGISVNQIVFLIITTWKGFDPGAQHFYGRLNSLQGSQCFDVTYKLSEEDAEHINKCFVTKDYGKLDGYKKGNSCSRFRSREKLIATAKKQFKKYFPEAKVLVLGDCAVVEPQEILVGPNRFKLEINKLARRAKEINYWDNEEEMQVLCDTWQEFWPIKYT